jgi:hypothetical protein
MRLTLLALLTSCAFAQTPAPQTLPPSFDWVGCGPSYNGHNFGVTCAGDILISAASGLSEYNAIDATFFKGKPSDTASMGLNLKAKSWTHGKWYARIDLLATGGVTQTPSATSFSAATGGFGTIMRQITATGWLTFGVGYRGTTTAGSPSIKNVMLGYSWGAR